MRRARFFHSTFLDHHILQVCYHVYTYHGRENLIFHKYDRDATGTITAMKIAAALGDYKKTEKREDIQKVFSMCVCDFSSKCSIDWKSHFLRKCPMEIATGLQKDEKARGASGGFSVFFQKVFSFDNLQKGVLFTCQFQCHENRCGAEGLPVNLRRNFRRCSLYICLIYHEIA